METIQLRTRSVCARVNGPGCLQDIGIGAEKIRAVPLVMSASKEGGWMDRLWQNTVLEVESREENILKKEVKKRLRSGEKASNVSRELERLLNGAGIEQEIYGEDKRPNRTFRTKFTVFGSKKQAVTPKSSDSFPIKKRLSSVFKFTKSS